MSDSSCPIAVPGTSVTVDDTITGAALVFVTTGDVVELRQRVAAMATMHNEHHAKMAAPPGMGDEGHAMGGMAPAGGSMGGMAPAGGSMAGMDHAGSGMGGMDHAGGGMKGMMMVPATVSKEDIAGGARMVFVAAPADVTALRDQLRMHAKMMAGGTCMMMGAH